MKKLLALILILAMVPVIAFGEYPLSENEKNYVGAWSMYADNGKGTIYCIMLVFADNMEVVQRSMTFKNGKLTSDHKASGIWSGFTDTTIIFTLAGEDMSAIIKDDGYLYMKFFGNNTLCGIFSKCPDMTETLGW